MAEPEKETKRSAGPRQGHVVAHRVPDTDHMPGYQFDDMLVFGQELDALRFIVGKTGWVYTAVSHGQSVVAQLEAASS